MRVPVSDHHGRVAQGVGERPSERNETERGRRVIDFLVSFFFVKPDNCIAAVSESSSACRVGAEKKWYQGLFARMASRCSAWWRKVVRKPRGFPVENYHQERTSNSYAGYVKPNRSIAKLQGRSESLHAVDLETFRAGTIKWN